MAIGGSVTVGMVCWTGVGSPWLLGWVVGVVQLFIGCWRAGLGRGWLLARMAVGGPTSWLLVGHCSVFNLPGMVSPPIFSRFVQT